MGNNLSLSPVQTSIYFDPFNPTSDKMNNIQISLDQSYTDSLNAKANLSFVNTNTTTLNNTISTKANSADVYSKSQSDIKLSDNNTLLYNAIILKAPLNNPAFTGTVTGISQSMVGLSNVNNTSDISKPISTATQTKGNINERRAIQNQLHVSERIQ